MQPGELLLSTGSYHSPMHLINGDCRLTYAGRARRVRGQEQAAGQQQQAAGAGGAAASSSQQQEAYTVRKGFDVAARAVVPLRRALQGLEAAA